MFLGLEMSFFFNFFWLVMIIFFMIGYGDFYFVSFCGRCVFVVIGFFGIGIIGFVFFVFVYYFEMNCNEKYFLKFLKEEKWKYKRRVVVVNVIKCYYWVVRCKEEKMKYLIWKEKFWRVVSEMWRLVKKYGSFFDIDLIDI